MRRAEAALHPVHGERLVNDKVGAQVKGLAHRGLAVDDGKGHGALVGGGSTQVAQHGGGARSIVAVNDHGIELALVQQVEGAVGAVGGISADLEIFHDAAQRADSLGIGGEQQGM